MTLAELVSRAHSTSRAHGWYDGDSAKRNIGEMLALIHSEVSEALEDYRTGEMQPAYSWLGIVDRNPNTRHPKAKPIGFPSEIADIVIRIGDLCGYLGIDLERAVVEKMAYNDTREYRHGGKVA